MISGAASAAAAAVAPKLVTATATVASTAATTTTTTTTTTTRSASTMMIRTMKGAAAGGTGGSRRPPSTASMIMGGRKNRFFDANTTNNCHYRRRWQSTYEYSSSSSSSGGSSSSSSSFFNGSNFSWSSFFSWYSKKLDTHPVTTKCISAGIISAVGNILAQGIAYYQEQTELDEKDASEYRRRWEQQQQQQQHLQQQQQQQLQQSSPRKPFEVDLAQVSRFAFLNVVFVAPVLHHWYQFINRAVPGKSLGRVAQRVFWDEFVFSPMYIPVFLGMLWKLEGSSNEDIVKMTKSEVPSIIIAEWALWVPGMFGIFRFVPVKFQVLAINSLGVVWQTFLAYMASHAHAKSTNAAEAASDVAVPVTTTTTVEEAGVINTNTLLVSTAADDHEEKNKTETATTTTTHVLPHIPGVVVEEEKVVPLVLNTIIRKHTPKYQEFDYDMSQGED